MSIEIAAVVSGISALSSVIQAWKSAIDIGKELSNEEIEQASIETKFPEKIVIEISKIIDDDLLEGIKENIEKAKKRLLEGLKDPVNNNQDKQREIDIANSAICAELERIKMLNGGDLPSQDLEKLWESHRCSK